MFKNYFKTAWRNLLKNKFYTGINILGLAIGLAVGIMILLWVQNEMSYDGFHVNAKNIYKINSHIGSGSSAQVWRGSPAPLAVFCRQSVPEVINSVRIKARENQLLFTYGNSKFFETNTAFVDPSFFSVFSFDLLKGNPAKPFNNDNSVVITASTAKKYFNTEDAVGKVLISGKDNFTVTGVVKDFPQNSNINYDILFPMSLYAKNFGGNGPWKTIDEDLGNFQYDIYLLIQKNVNAETVSKKISQLYQNKRKGEPDVVSTFFSLQPLTSLHLITADGNSSALQTVRIFLIIAILILIIACINYVNLSTARSMLRSKEVSMRKIIGASKFQLFIQFIIESVVLFALASLLAFIVIYLLLPLYNKISGEQLVLDLSNTGVWLVVGSAIAGTLILGSVYPALLLTSFKPLQVLKGKLTVGIGTASFRKVLVVSQFTFSVLLIIGTIVITKQLQYIKEKDLGYNKEHVFSVGLTQPLHDHFAAVRNELLQQPSIFGVAASDNHVIGVGSTTGDTYWDGKPQGSMFLIHPNGIDENFIPLLKMQIIAGKNFTGTPADSSHLILNETAVKQAGIKDPIGKSFTLWQTRGTIIGVIKDFNYASLKQAIEPAIFYYDPPNWIMYIKTTGKDAAAAIAATQKVWKQYEADFPFQYSFLDDAYNTLYRSDERAGILIEVFATVAILISCLGLFGLITFTANIKTKEIGIRKVLGASVSDITVLLAKEFMLLVIIAFAIAAPLAWYFMHQWLQDFAYRISISWWMIAVAGITALLIALITVSFRAIKAAMANPVRSLRTE
ncbi:MAG TPA: ABC transporter permease [Chitinophagaceae bacterium]|nr:ABC transporter permease [Chitinophagaceae bacterium]